MKLHRLSRLVATCIALLSMLFMQVAVASYACPVVKAADNSTNIFQTMRVMDESMPGCQGMDVDQVSLCHAHAHDFTSKQSLDKAELPSVQAFVPIALVMTIELTQPDACKFSARLDMAQLHRTTAPPISIQHCCFRI